MTVSLNHLEVEVKFHLSSPSSMRQRLDAMGAVARDKVFETNVRFDDQDGSLFKKNQLLRLRRDKKCRLTFKCPSRENQSECKIYQELEVEISDLDTMTAMLNALGYQGVQVYEKWRRTFEWGNVLICMDTMPYGDFLEIEGPQTSIQAAAKVLDLFWEKRILSNYLAIFEILRKDNHLPFNDVTFDNFKRHPVDITHYLHLIEDGK